PCLSYPPLAQRCLRGVGGCRHRSSRIRPRRLARAQAVAAADCDVRFPRTLRDVADIVPRSRKVFRKAQRGSVLEKLFWLQRYIDVFHVSFAVAIGKNSKTFHTLVVSPSI